MAYFQLKAFCDESYADVAGDYTDKPFIIGGLISYTREWKKFDREWTRLLKAERLPYIHMADLDAGYDVYRGLDEAERNRIQRVFIEAINRFDVHGVVAGITQDDFPRLFEKLAPYRPPLPGQKQAMLTPYLFSLEACFHAMFARLKGHEEKQLVFVFDRQNEYEARAQTVRSWLANSDSYVHSARLGPLTYCDKRVCIALQAADVVVYECMRELRDPHEKRWQLALLERRRQIHREYFDSRLVDNLLSSFDERFGHLSPPVQPTSRTRKKQMSP
ncbi:MAG: DUF3800 domain-containing protein [Thermoanaerobaculia bacterium]